MTKSKCKYRQRYTKGITSQSTIITVFFIVVFVSHLIISGSCVSINNFPHIPSADFHISFARQRFSIVYVYSVKYIY
jgi:hypothetical protein